MQLSNQMFTINKPSNFFSASTSSLLKKFIYDFNDPNIPVFSPIGTAILNNIEDIFCTVASEYGIDEIRIPMIMSTELLRRGQQLGELFERKLMSLSGNMAHYHLMTTPETLFLNMASKDNLPASRLPLNYCFISDFCRDMPDPKHILRTKQFRVFAGVSLDANTENRMKTEKHLLYMLHDMFSGLGVPFHTEHGGSGFTCEYFYMLSKENENYIIPSIDPKKKTKALSFAMIYDYGKGCDTSQFTCIDPVTGIKDKMYITSYAISTQRVLYNIMDYYRDNKGFGLPAHLRPCDIVLISGPKDTEILIKIKKDLNKSGIKSYVDNCYNKPHVKRLETADYIGSGYKAIVKNEKISIIDRNGTPCVMHADISTGVNTLRQIMLLQKTQSNHRAF